MFIKLMIDDEHDLNVRKECCINIQHIVKVFQFGDYRAKLVLTNSEEVYANFNNLLEKEQFENILFMKN